MTAIPSHNAAWLLKAAKELALQLKTQKAGTTLRIRPPAEIYTIKSNTGGWAAVIGSLGKGRPGLEVWLDNFTGHATRKLCVCFYTREAEQVRSLSRNAAKHLWPVRVLTDADVEEAKILALKKSLARTDFNAPIEEHYGDSTYNFFGFYDPTRKSSATVSPQFIERAVGFVLDVARSLPDAKDSGSPAEVYPRCENRTWVKVHLRRERSGYLAAECKNRDDYRCQVCRLKFATKYGPLGEGFAEAHHRKPLASLSDTVTTKLEDLITVCANCHRMLHRMEGKPGDIKRLQVTVSKHRKRKP